MSKKQQAIDFLRKNRQLFQCPVCGQSFLEVREGSFACEKGHSFDVSKKGTIHFLMKQSKNEYGKNMLLSRFSIAQEGLFDGILDEAYNLIEQKDGVVLDVGCGEGSHLNYMYQKGLNGTRIGFDISKEAIQLAAAHFTSAFWCVADLAQSPFAGDQYDTLLNIFSPSNYQEFSRLLKSGGQVLKVIPGEQHLFELRQALYRGEPEKETYSNELVFEKFREHYPECTIKKVRYSFDLNEERLKDLMKMTPLSWDASEKQISEVLSSRLEAVTVDGVILIGRKD